MHNPVKRLDQLTEFLMHVERDGVTNPLAKLDFLYSCILADIPDEIIPTTWRILAHVIFAREIDRYDSEFLYGSAQGLCNLIGVDQSMFYSALRNLYSVVAVPSRRNALTTPLRFYHASFPDFLVDAKRSGKFVIRRDEALVDIINSLFHWHEIDATHFHSQDEPMSFRMHLNHTALPGLKWISDLSGADALGLANSISEFVTEGCRKGCKVLGPNPDLLPCMSQLGMRYFSISIYSWSVFLNDCYEKDLLGKLCRTKPSNEFDVLLLDHLKAMATEHESVRPASFPLTWHATNGSKFREFVLMGHDNKPVVLWYTEHDA
ncbi:hypothetical protein NP233_g10080 [Leucocoprinus birnbaumii]|uniref:Uncharacterized protein n=1 Tax=Leucocoprinus birnbaumii TaxID=56174 RepID=A0AAD5VIZ9_9AGAR|nr:hypothetical protein NP233_g10080 [Leucocoprinus birnbaumii]